MRLRLACLGLLMMFFVFCAGASACGLDQTPFFRVDGVIADYYALTGPILQQSSINLPQDTAHKNFLVGEAINFEVDKGLVTFRSSKADHVVMDWDYGDGTKGEGYKNVHTYSKPGSYILSINASSTVGEFDTYLLESIILNVLPNKDYKLPQAIITIDGQQPKSPYTDYFRMDWSKLSLDGSKSTALSSKIVSYEWDFGDSKSSKDVASDHGYSKNYPAIVVFPVLRVKDENGFISDAFLQVMNKDKFKNFETSEQDNYIDVNYRAADYSGPKTGSADSQSAGAGGLSYWLTGGVLLLLALVVAKAVSRMVRKKK